mgnify:CR=1 FL=1
MSSDNGREVTPDSIPNSEVKLSSADGSWGLSPARVGRCWANLKGCFNIIFETALS